VRISSSASGSSSSFHTGTLYLDDCPVQRFIPIYLVVAGCFILVKGIMSIAEAYHKKDLNKDEEYQRPRVFSRADGLVGCFLFCWFIAGGILFSLLGIRGYFYFAQETCGFLATSTSTRVKTLRCPTSAMLLFSCMPIG
jgi:hypothetical protein